MAMASSGRPLRLSFVALLFLASVTLISASLPSALALSHGALSSDRGKSRSVLSFRETREGSNATFECSPSGPCVPCLYSEKNDEKYRCSETGYRIPLKCVEIRNGSKEEKKEKKSQKSRSTLENSSEFIGAWAIHKDAEKSTISTKHRRLLDDSSTSESGRKVYITYRSCVLSVNEEKMSVVGFEGIMLCMLLVSASVIYMRRKRAAAMPGVGAVRVQTNSRF